VADDVLQLLEYVDADGRSPFGHWFGRLNPIAAAKVTVVLYRLGHGNFSNVKGVGAEFTSTKSISDPATHLFWQGRRPHHHPARRQRKETPRRRNL
jgi:hypothetical protein